MHHVSRFARVIAFASLLGSASLVGAQAPAPATSPPSAPAEEKPLFRFFGILKPTILVGNGLESFGNTNYVAVTAAANPLMLRNPNATALSFQAQQTRVGMAVGENTPVKGLIELDFVDFAKASPAQGTGLRVRQAYVEWTVRDGHKLTLGQLWDMFSPLNSHTYDLVGGMFQSGNSGFMRHQLIYTSTFGGFEAAFALGMTTQNLTALLGNVEYGRVPTMAARASYRIGKTAWFGAAVMGTRLTFDANAPSEETTLAAGGNLFADLTFGILNLRVEAYGGQNLNNLGMLVLSQGTAANDVSDVGGFLSAKITASAQHALHFVAGGAYVLNPDDMALGYAPAVPATGDAPAIAAARLPGNGPGIERNIGLRVGHAYTFYKGASIVTEPFLFMTRHKLDPAATVDEDRLGWGVQTGGLYVF